TFVSPIDALSLVDKIVSHSRPGVLERRPDLNLEEGCNTSFVQRGWWIIPNPAIPTRRFEPEDVGRLLRRTACPDGRTSTEPSSAHLQHCGLMRDCGHDDRKPDKIVEITPSGEPASFDLLRNGFGRLDSTIERIGAIPAPWRERCSNVLL